MASQKNFDVFISYQWKIQKEAASLKEALSKKYRVWIDVEQLKPGKYFYDELAKGISDSKCVLCCITREYAESESCKYEISFAKDCNKPFIILMFERLQIADLGGVGLLISPKLRINLYRNPEVYQSWIGPLFDEIIQCIDKELISNSDNSNDMHKSLDIQPTRTNFAKNNVKRMSLMSNQVRTSNLKPSQSFSSLVDLSENSEIENINNDNNNFKSLVWKFENKTSNMDLIPKIPIGKQPKNVDKKDSHKQKFNELINEFKQKCQPSDTNKFSALKKPK